jgi:hypothetical protein
MLCGRVDKVAKAQLLQVVQTLELRSVNDAGQGLDDLD